MRLRQRLYHLLEPTAWGGPGLSPVNQAITVLICIAVALAILGSEPALHDGNEALFLFLEIVLTTIFMIEYGLRIWVAGEEETYKGVWGRIRYALTPSAIIDLLAILPVFLLLLGGESLLLRLFRLLKILRLARLGRFSSGINAISAALKSRRYELFASFLACLIVLLVTSTLLYVVEGEEQPEQFGSIPRAMWWSIATLTTVGYGDVYPVTPLGRILAGFTAITGIGLIAMPTGILAAAFSDAVQEQKKMHEKKDGSP